MGQHCAPQGLQGALIGIGQDRMGAFVVPCRGQGQGFVVHAKGGHALGLRQAVQGRGRFRHAAQPDLGPCADQHIQERAIGGPIAACLQDKRVILGRNRLDQKRQRSSL